MNQPIRQTQGEKGFVNIILILIVVAFIGAGAYFVSVSQIPSPAPLPNPTPISSPSSTPTPTPSPSPSSTSASIPKPTSTSTSTSTPTSKCDGQDLNGDGNPDSGKCPEGCVNWGIPLGCVTQKYYDDCQSDPGGCVICLAGNALIDTPLGSVPVKNMQVGVPIWTIDRDGRRIPGIVTKTSKVPVPLTHQMVHLILDDGRELFVSPGHPTIDGRIVGDIEVGGSYDGASVVSVERVSYDEGATYDVLSSGDTGFYWANGILLDSTLH